MQTNFYNKLLTRRRSSCIMSSYTLFQNHCEVKNNFRRRRSNKQKNSKHLVATDQSEKGCVRLKMRTLNAVRVDVRTINTLSLSTLKIESNKQTRGNVQKWNSEIESRQYVVQEWHKINISRQISDKFQKF